jgi:hypothetical protein
MNQLLTCSKKNLLRTNIFRNFKYLAKKFRLKNLTLFFLWNFFKRLFSKNYYAHFTSKETLYSIFDVISFNVKIKISNKKYNKTTQLNFVTLYMVNSHTSPAQI